MCKRLELKQKRLSCSNFQARNISSHSNLHDATKAITEVPEVGTRLPE